MVKIVKFIFFILFNALNLRKIASVTCTPVELNNIHRPALVRIVFKKFVRFCTLKRLGLFG